MQWGNVSDITKKILLSSHKHFSLFFLWVIRLLVHNNFNDGVIFFFIFQTGSRRLLRTSGSFPSETRDLALQPSEPIHEKLPVALHRRTARMTPATSWSDPKIMAPERASERERNKNEVSSEKVSAQIQIHTHTLKERKKKLEKTWGMFIYFRDGKHQRGKTRPSGTFEFFEFPLRRFHGKYILILIVLCILKVPFRRFELCKS